MKKIKFICLLVGCCLLWSCIKVEPKSAKQQDNEPVLSAEKKRDAITYQIFGKDEPNQYRIQFQKTQNVFFRKIKAGAGRVDHCPESQCVDEDVSGGDHLVYEFFEQSEGRQVLLQTLNIDVPQDLVFEGRVLLNEMTLRSKGFEIEGNGVFRKAIALQFQRVFFAQDSVLITNGENLQIKAEGIYFHHALIQTFDAGQTAAIGKEGRSGGLLDFQADKMSGDVVVELRGENGGQGLEGPPPDEKLQGANGFPGVAAEAASKVCAPSELMCGECKAPAKPGGPGEQGREGYRGGTGRRGGLSGELRWSSGDTSNLNWRVLKVPGLGGSGGMGGKGGAGGKAGVAPVTSAAMFCPPPLQAPDGSQGPLGPTGLEGIPGEEQLACVQTGTEKNCR